MVNWSSARILRQPGETIVFSTNSTGTIVSPNRMNLDFILYTKTNSKLMKDLSVRAKTIKFSEENINLCDLILSNQTQRQKHKQQQQQNR